MNEKNVMSMALGYHHAVTDEHAMWNVIYNYYNHHEVSYLMEKYQTDGLRTSDKQEICQRACGKHLEILQTRIFWQLAYFIFFDL